MRFYSKEMMDLRHRLDTALLDISESVFTSVEVYKIFSHFVAAIEQIRDDLAKEATHPEKGFEATEVDKEIANELKELLRKEQLTAIFQYDGEKC